jgi:hypothetical protein
MLENTFAMVQGRSSAGRPCLAKEPKIVITLGSGKKACLIRTRFPESPILPVIFCKREKNLPGPGTGKTEAVCVSPDLVLGC